MSSEPGAIQFLHVVLGFGSNFKHGGREFDGFRGGATYTEALAWIEAKSAGYWNMMDDAKRFAKFRSITAEQRIVAEKAGKSFEIHSGGPIPDAVKEWLDGNGILYLEFLD